MQDYIEKLQEDCGYSDEDGDISSLIEYKNALEDRVGGAHEFIELLNKYGEAKFGDEWWPGNPDAWLGDEDAIRLTQLSATF